MAKLQDNFNIKPPYHPHCLHQIFELQALGPVEIILEDGHQISLIPFDMEPWIRFAWYESHFKVRH